MVTYKLWLNDIVKDIHSLVPYLGRKIEYQDAGLVAAKRDEMPMHLVDLVTMVRGGRDELRAFWQPKPDVINPYSDPALKWVEIITRRLFARTSWVFYLHHLLTPMHVNVCAELDEQGDRVRLWQRLIGYAGHAEWAADKCIKRARAYRNDVPTDWTFYPRRVTPREVMT